MCRLPITLRLGETYFDFYNNILFSLAMLTPLKDLMTPVRLIFDVPKPISDNRISDSV